jgi:hypothetical protein
MNNLVFEVKVHYNYVTEKCYGHGAVCTLNVNAKNDVDAREIAVKSVKNRFNYENEFEVNYCEINHVLELIN